jgi:hypothetical protein
VDRHAEEVEGRLHNDLEMPDLPLLAVMKVGEGIEVVVAGQEWKAEF